jgi:hypothetical protein
MCLQRVSGVELVENCSGALRGTTGDGQLPVKYHDFSFTDFSNISKVPQRINPFQTTICLELEVFQVVKSCRLLSCYQSFRGT